MRKKIRISIDPGLSGAGIAIWSSKNWNTPKGLLSCYLLKATSRKKITWEMQGQKMALELQALIKGFDVEKIYCEFPILYANNAKGLAAAANGSVMKLSYVVGCFATTVELGKFEAILVRDWKGQLSKEIIIRRIKRKLGESFCKSLSITSHCWDAVGIGLYAKGCL